MTENESPVVRSYAFKALAIRKHDHLLTLLMRHIYDTAKFTSLSGDVGLWLGVNDVMLSSVYPRRGYNPYPNRYQLTKKEKETIDSIILFDATVRFEFGDFLIMDMEPEIRYYDRIREIALKGKRPAVTVLLAKFKNEKDVAIIRKFFESKETSYYGLKAADIFPHASFYPYVRKIFKERWQTDEPYFWVESFSDLYMILARYPSMETYKLFEKATLLTNKDAYQALCTELLVAITLFPNKIYEPLKAKIKLDEMHNSEVERRLKNEN